MCITINRHTIRSDVWTTFKLNQSADGTRSIHDAIKVWLQNRGNTTFQFRDSCQGPHCNDACPEMFVLDELISNDWPASGKAIFILIVVGVALFCAMMKMFFVVWLWRLEWKQQLYLGLLGDESHISSIETALHVSYTM